MFKKIKAYKEIGTYGPFKGKENSTGSVPEKVLIANINRD